MNTNTEREELIELLDNERWKPMAADPSDDFSCGFIEQSNPSVADSILAAGYSKPRTITTVEELDALPAGSVVLEADNGPLMGIEIVPGVFHKFPQQLGWHVVAGHGARPTHEIELPATVLFTPEATR